jgi:hypothetical protein
VHTGVLEPLQFLDEYVCTELDKRTKRYKEWAAAQGDKTILTTAEYAEVKAIAKAVKGHKRASALLAQGEPELTIVWRDGTTELLCKARPDWLSEDVLADLKTARDIDARFHTAIARYGYHIQMAHYSNGLATVPELTDDDKPRDVKFIAVESATPYDVAVHVLPWLVMSEARDRCSEGLHIIAAAEHIGYYPGIAPDSDIPVELPRWAMSREDG